MFTYKFSRRHLAKTFSWRFIGTLDTVLLSWFIAGSASVGLQIGAVELISKLLLYYAHERLWYKSKINNANKRHIFKTFSWRGIGTLDTIVLGWIISGSPLTGLKIGGSEVFTKMILYFFHEKLWYKINYGLDMRLKKKIQKNSISKKYKMSKNIVPHNYKTTRSDREIQKKQSSKLLWFTGLSGSGKSTIANAVEQALQEQGLHTYILDGDNVRQGINKDLSFVPEDRSENIRRIAEISKIMLDAGLVTLAAFVSPYIKDRMVVKNIVGPENFIEIYINTSLAECERRDVKGLYQKARAGEIKNMTGLSAPYEAPVYADLEIVTDGQTVAGCVDSILKFLNNKLKK